MREPKAKVRNAADHQQVGKAAESDVDDAEQARDDLGVVLSTVEGRRFYWNLMGKKCKTFESVFAGGHGTLMAHSCGKQDVGHALLADVMEQHPLLYLAMQREHMLATLNMEEPSPTQDNG